MVGNEYPQHLNESTRCPVPYCNFTGTLVQVHSHLHGMTEEIHKKVAERYSNAYYPPSDKVFEMRMQRNKAEEYAEKLDQRSSGI